MTPDERMLLERSVKLSEENHKILRSIQKKARWAFIWGIIKFAILVVPIIIGLFLLQPYVGSIKSQFQEAKELLNSL